MFFLYWVFLHLADVRITNKEWTSIPPVLPYLSFCHRKPVKTALSIKGHVVNMARYRRGRIHNFSSTKAQIRRRPTIIGVMYMVRTQKRDVIDGAPLLSYLWDYYLFCVQLWGVQNFDCYRTYNAHDSFLHNTYNFYRLCYIIKLTHAFL